MERLAKCSGAILFYNPFTQHFALVRPLALFVDAGNKCRCTFFRIFQGLYLVEHEKRIFTPECIIYFALLRLVFPCINRIPFLPKKTRPAPELRNVRFGIVPVHLFNYPGFGFKFFRLFHFFEKK